MQNDQDALVLTPPPGPGDMLTSHAATPIHGAHDERMVFHYKREDSDVYIGRPGPWGNPWGLESESDRGNVISRHGTWIAAQPHLMRLARRELAGKRLGCWCAPKACHGDTLARIANNPGLPSEDPVFVFGSNTRGRHGKGAARFAVEWRGAEEGCAQGRTGNAYAIPTRTMRPDGGLETLPMKTIEAYVDTFLDYAKLATDQSFQLTRVGCGLAGCDEETMIELFRPALQLVNVEMPERWVTRLSSEERPIRVIVAGSRSFSDDSRDNLHWVSGHLDQLLDRVFRHARAEAGPWPIIVSGGARGIDTLGEKYAMSRMSDQAVPFMRFPAEWDRYGKRSAGAIRNQQMARASTHLVAFWDGSSRGTMDMINTAKADGLITRVITRKP